jgi:UDP-N-acetylglucosamine--N-acetylmuramyl-(pentapeptide) pyrophosphoryl-undecaprenol N-acetylglucosamine transferase
MSDVVSTIYLAGGGTGGHLYPGIAVAEALRATFPQAKPVFLCTTREIDKTILSTTGFEFRPQPIVPPPVRRTSVGGLIAFWKSWRETKDLVKTMIRQTRPAIVLGLGGYAAGVAVKVAAKRGIPTVILNPDAIPGQANQYLMRYSKAVCCQFEASRERIPPEHRDKIHVTGCPIRSDILALPPREEAAARLGVDPLLKTLVITGASQGAKTVNEAAVRLMSTLTLRGWQILHLSGKDHAESVRAGYREAGVSAGVIDFTPAMADVWAVADLAISRSGASSCAELTACGIPSILMPYPFHKDLHQRANAKILADAGAAVLCDDEKDARKNADKLRPLIEPLLYDAAKRGVMAESAKKLGRPDAAAAVAAIITQMAASGR